MAQHTPAQIERIEVQSQADMERWNKELGLDLGLSVYRLVAAQKIAAQDASTTPTTPEWTAEDYDALNY